MEDIKEKIQQVKQLLQEIENGLSPLLNPTSKVDKKIQLDAVVKMADKFEKISTELPVEIRTLKFKLIQDIDQFKEAEQLNQELQNTLRPFFSNIEKKERKRKTKSSGDGTKKQVGVKLIDLINAKLIKPHTKIVKCIKGQNYEASITSDGKVRLDINGRISVQNSLSWAAMELTGKAVNGWTWWEIEEDGTRRNLDYYRQKITA